MSVCLVSLGSNLGDRRANLDSATGRLARLPGVQFVARSAWHETAPVGGPSGQPRYLNGVVALKTALAPHKLLARLQQIETDLGRRRGQRCGDCPDFRASENGTVPFARWGPRTIDLDLLLVGRTVLDTPTLVLPHPRMAWRRFVLEPASEVAGSMRHPTIGWSIARLLRHLNETKPYVAIAGPIAAGKTWLARRLAREAPARLISERPDWRRLGAFYADPAVHAWQTELEFLSHRTHLLGADAPAWAERRWAISDFWFDQSAAFARVWLPVGRRHAFLERFKSARRTVERPRLIVLLDAPADELLVRVRRRRRGCERPLTAAPLERIRRALVEQAARAGVGPVLRIAGDSESVFAEALAAVRGME
jgi:2-amino-4-hydroxy-6-hydroxymethyldihydropteridine diphosphokinase